MYVYLVRSTRNGYWDNSPKLRLASGVNWSTFEPGTATIWVHPELDFHYVRGQLFLDGKQANLMECPPNYRIKENGVFILAHNYDMALELLRP